MKPYRRGVAGTAIRMLLFPVVALSIGALGSPLRAERPRVYAITGARVIAAPGTVIENGTVVLRDGLIEAVGGSVPAPADAFVIDAGGMTVTAGFIDGCTDIAQKKQETGGEGPRGGFRSGPPSAPPGPVHPVARIHPENRVVETLVTDATAFEKHRAMGFTTALTLPSSGIFRGEAALIELGDGPVPANILRAEAGQVVAFEHGGFGEGYPTSLMGSIAAIRQAVLDARRQALWETRYEANPSGMERPEAFAAFDALEPAAAGKELTIFDVPESDNVARALSLSSDLSLDTLIIGSGLESSRHGLVEALARSHRPVILPLAYPEKPKVENPDEALNTTLEDLEAWDAAPGNPEALRAAGVPFALGTCRLPGATEFPERLRKAIERGLPPEAALAALTVQPAKFLGVDTTLGTIEPGKIANVVVFEGAPADGAGVFDKKSAARYVFVDGEKYDIEKKKSKGDPNARVDPRGSWSVTFTISGRSVNRVWTIAGTEGSYSGTAETQSGTVSFSSVDLAGNAMTVVLPARGNRPSQELVVVITGETLEGEGEFPGGMSYSIKGKRTSGPDGGAL